MWFKIKRLIAVLVLVSLTDADLTLDTSKWHADKQAQTVSRSV